MRNMVGKRQTRSGIRTARFQETLFWALAAIAALLFGRRLLDRLRIRPAAPSGTRPRVVVVGAGFGGLSVVRTLGNHDEVEVLVLDRNNYHGFWPLLYQVATAGLEATSIAAPVRGIVRKYRNVGFLMAGVLGVDFDRKLLLTHGKPISYDYLVLAAGSTNNYFGNDELARQTLALKDIDEAEAIRNHVLCAFEQAVREEDPERRKSLMTFVVVGAGPTGVELAGAFAELIYHVLRHDYPSLDVAEARVVLVEALDKLLATFPDSLQRSALRRLEQIGVRVMFGKAVESVEGGKVRFKDGSSLTASTVIWTAGVRAPDIADGLEVPKARGGRVKVEPTLNLPGRPEIFVIGDMAYLEGYKDGQAYPMVAPVAIQQGRQAALNILALEAGRPLRPFRYSERGQMATIGRRAAVLDSHGIRLTGFIAWLGWLFVHLIELISFRSRLVVLVNWAYNYFTYDRGVRILTGTERYVETGIPAGSAEPAARQEAPVSQPS